MMVAVNPQRNWLENALQIGADLWGWLGQNAEPLGALLNFGILVAAALTAWFGIKTLRQAEHDSRERTRPYVYADVVPGLAGPSTWDLVITNAGQSMARNLTLEIDNWPEKDDDISESIRTLATAPRDLAPGARLRAFWRVNGDPRPGMPEQARITTHYDSDDPKASPYSDANVVMLDSIGHTPRGHVGPEPWEKMGKTAKSFYRMLQAISSNIRELGR